MPRARNTAAAVQQVPVHLLEPLKLAGQRHEPGSTVHVPPEVAEELLAAAAALPSDQAPAQAPAEAQAPAAQAELMPHAE